MAATEAKPAGATAVHPSRAGIVSSPRRRPGRPALVPQHARPGEPASLPRIQVLIRPIGSHRPLDITGDLTGAIAHSLWRAGSENEVLNWLEAERILGALLGHNGGTP